MKIIYKILTLFIILNGAAMAKTFHDFNANTIESKNKSLSDYKGKVLLVVNTASKCGYTPQYEALETLQEKYASKGFTVLGFPSNDFGSQEPGTNEEIKNFCTLNFKVKFPLFSKGPVKGADAQPVFKWLSQEADSKLKGDIAWNFEKFLIDQNGKLIKRYKSNVKPTDKEITEAIESLIK